MTLSKLQHIDERLREALDNFPYPELKSCDRSTGNLLPQNNEDADYAENFGFLAGSLIGDRVWASGEIRLIGSYDYVDITCWFKLFLERENGLELEILSEDIFLWGCYDANTKKWNFGFGYQ